MRDRHVRSAGPRRTPLSLVVVIALLAGVLALAACGSNNSSGGADTSKAAAAPAASTSTDAGTVTPAGTAASGTPIKAMTITSLDSQGPVYPNIAVTAKAYEKWVNARGGIGGRPLSVDVCDEHGKPTDAAACARKAVSDKVAAVVGSFSFLGTNIMPALTKAGIAAFGECCPITAPQWTGKNSFPMGTQPLYAVALIKRAVADGCKKINAVIIDGAQGFVPPMKNAMKAYGMSFGKTVILPPTGQDYSPQVAEATSGGADCVVMIVSETPYVAWNQAWVQSGTTARMYGPQGNLDNVSIKGLGNKLDGSVIAGMYPDLSTAPWADYRQALKDANADPANDYNSLGGMGTWAAYTGFKQVAEAVPGGANKIDATSFMAQAAKTTNLDTKGMVPVIDFTKPWTANPPFSRLFNRTAVYSTIKGGKVVPLTTAFEDVGELALGHKPTS
ncbi:MAG: branched-chain amino acid transport system substrate-binding protein [Baekduia sp.]|nr:branched-chain amino acid transport system substrate-binding protein [Baekduia sp.]